MPPPVVRPPARRRWLWIVLTFVLIVLTTLGVLAVGVASCFHQNSDTRTLRMELTRASGAEWRQQVALSVGGVTLGLVRAGLSFAPLDPEAEAALRTVRGVEVSVYELASGFKRPESSAMLVAADGVMTARGWERVVGVMDRGQLVGVYLPREISSVRRVKACVVVMEGHQMVVVSARANLELLLECVRNNPQWRAEVRSLASR